MDRAKLSKLDDLTRAVLSGDNVLARSIAREIEQDAEPRYNADHRMRGDGASKKHVFISWNGPAGRLLARGLRDLLLSICPGAPVVVPYDDRPHAIRDPFDMPGELMRAARLAIRCVGGDTIGLDGSGAEMAFLSEFVGPERALVYPLGVEGLPGHADLVGDGLPLFTVTEAGTRELVARLHALDPDFAALDAATIAERFDAAWPTLARAIAEATPLAVPPPPLVYDAHVAPDPGPWLAASDERYDAVVRYHLGGTAPDEELPLSAQAHFTFHVAVENELAKGDIPAMARALERLILQGLTRHEAIHELIAVTCRECARKLDGDEEADEAFVRDLEKLSPHDRRGAELDEVGWISRSARARRRGMN